MYTRLQIILFLTSYVTSHTVTFTPAEKHLYLSSNLTSHISEEGLPVDDGVGATGYSLLPSRKSGLIHFHFDTLTIQNDNEKSQIVKKAIQRGMEILEGLSCVRFIESNIESSIKIVYRGDTDITRWECSVSSIVMNMGFNCITPATIFHELFHVLGFSHEQARTDRGEYLNMISHSMQSFIEGYQNVFPFSFTSLMLYSSNAKTLIAQPKYRDVYWPKAADIFLSRRNVVALNVVYKCSKFAPSDEFEQIVDHLGSFPNLQSKMNMLDQKIFTIPQTVFIGKSIDWGSRWRQEEKIFELNVRRLVAEMPKRSPHVSDPKQTCLDGFCRMTCPKLPTMIDSYSGYCANYHKKCNLVKCTKNVECQDPISDGLDTWPHFRWMCVVFETGPESFIKYQIKVNRRNAVASPFKPQ